MALVITVGVGRPEMSSSVWSRTWYFVRTILVRGCCGYGWVASGCLGASADTRVAACCNAAASGVRP